MQYKVNPPMIVLRADAMGLCFGVRDALRIAAEINDPARVAIHGELVHNERVLVDLRSRGFQMTPEANRGQLPPHPTLLVSAHGISQRELRKLEQAGKQIIDTTCPLVRRVHRAAQALAQEGFHVLILGRTTHVEVRGITEDLERFDVLESVSDVQTWPCRKLGIVCQTTMPPRLADEIRAAILRANPGSEVRFIDTICQPTRDRQEAVERLIRQVDAMVVVGGANSHNTRQLAARCRSAGIATWHVQGADDLNPRWFDGVQVVGLTAGTSTTNETIEEVYRALCRLPSGMPSS